MNQARRLLESVVAESAAKAELVAANRSLGEKFNGHGSVKGACGHRLCGCRCSHGPEQVLSVSFNCQDCGGPKVSAY